MGEVEEESESNMKYEESATLTTRTGWACNHCSRFYEGDNESSSHAARWCCSDDQPCPTCDGRKGRGRSYCDACCTARDAAQWDAMPEMDWDGSTALAIWNADKYFFSSNELLDFIEERFEETDPLLKAGDHNLLKAALLAGSRLVICEKVEMREFEFSEFFQDEMADEYRDDDYSHVDEMVNTILKHFFPATWMPTHVRASVESLCNRLGINAEQPA